ncbi:MAG: hypothetical protein DME74_10790 [Verrucomicrobia bacterium]|nr:MAG: hypothetical protein DME74_10790 [Verrucomicrobiota bacterium]
MRLACWRTRARGRGLLLAKCLLTKYRTTKDCFGAMPKPARETRALPGFPISAWRSTIAMGRILTLLIVSDFEI